MRLQKTVAVLTLARALAGSFEGLTLDEMAALVGAGRWTAERIRDAVEAAFEPLEREDDGGRVRFRLAAPSLGNFAAAPTAAEFAELENAARALDASRDAGRAALQRAAKDGIRSVHCSAIAIAWGYDKSDVNSETEACRNGRLHAIVHYSFHEGRTGKRSFLRGPSPAAGRLRMRTVEWADPGVLLGRNDGIFLTWTARNPLKSPDSDEGIQENPSPFSWSSLGWLWFGLEEFGPRRYGDGRSLLPRLSIRRGRSEIRLGSYDGMMEWKWCRKRLKRFNSRREMAPGRECARSGSISPLPHPAAPRPPRQVRRRRRSLGASRR